MATVTDLQQSLNEGVDEVDFAAQVDERIAKALGLKPAELEDLPAEPGVMSTPSVLSAVRATVYVHC
jgi:hypothetical protein